MGELKVCKIPRDKSWLLNSIDMLISGCDDAISDMPENERHYKAKQKAYIFVKGLAEQLEDSAQPENKPLSLEELRQMDGEPVWAVPIAKIQGISEKLFMSAEWCLVDLSHSVFVGKEEVKWEVLVCKDESFYTIDRNFDYLRIYAHKPEQEEK